MILTDKATFASPTLVSGGRGAVAFSKEQCLSRYTWGNNCQGWNFADTDQLSVKQELMPPGTFEQLHYHRFATQFFFILTGTALFTIDGEVKMLNTQQGIQIFPGQQHYISNHSQVDLEFILYSYPSTKNDRHVPTLEEGIKDSI